MKTLYISLLVCVYSVLDVNAQWGSNNYYNSKPRYRTNFSSSITIQSYDGQPIQQLLMAMWCQISVHKLPFILELSETT